MDFILDGFRQAFALLFSLNAETYATVSVTMVSTVYAMIATMIIGMPLGFLLGYYRFPGRRFIRLISDTLLSFPTVLVGLLVYAFISRRGPLGELGLLFTIEGMAVGQTILALPIAISLTAQSVEGMDIRFKQTLLTLGARGRQALVTTFWELRYALLLVTVTAFGRIFTEVGVAMMLGGNIKWETRTITTSIALETGKGEFAQGIALGIVLLFVAFMINAALTILRRRERA